MYSHKAEYFKHIGNEFLSDDFHNELFHIKFNIHDNSHRCGLKITFDDLDKLSFIDLLSFSSKTPNKNDLVLPEVSYEKSGEKYLNQFIFSAMLYDEFDFLKKNDPSFDPTKYLGNKQIKSLLDLRHEGHLFNKHRNEFLLSYYSSYVKSPAARFKLSLRVNSLLSCDLNTNFRHPFDKKGLSSLSAITIDNASFFTKLESGNDWLFAVESFIPFGLDQILVYDFLHNDPVAYKQELYSALSEFNNGKTDIETADLLITHWFSKQCMLFFAYHLDIDKLDGFVSSIASALAATFNFNDDAKQAAEIILKKYAMAIEPNLFADQGYSFLDFIKPLNGFYEFLESRFSSSTRLISSCTDSNYTWVATSIVSYFNNHVRSELNANEIVDYFDGERYKYQVINFIRPKGYLEFFLSDQCKASTEHQLKMARNLLKMYDHTDCAQVICNTCLTRVIRNTGDKPLNPSKIEFLIFDKDSSVSELRKHGVLGNYSAVTALELDSNFFREDMSILSNISKRALLIDDLDI